MPIPKAAPRKISLTRSRGKTRIYTDTPVRDEVEKKSIEKKIKPTKINAKRKLFVKQGKRKKLQPTVISSSSEEVDIPYEKESEVDSLILDEKIEPNLGDYVVVIAKGKLRSLQYVARVDDYDDENDEYEEMFLQIINSGVYSDGPLLIVNEQNAASFAADDIILKLPSPVAIGRSARRNNLLQFNFDFSKLELA